jgi:hypothetical protein
MDFMISTYSEKGQAYSLIIHRFGVWTGAGWSIAFSRGVTAFV